MDGPRDCHMREVREGQTSYDIPYMWNLKRNDTNELRKQKLTHRLREQTYGCQGEGIIRAFWMDMYTLLYLKWVTNRTYFLAQETLVSVMCQPG